MFDVAFVLFAFVIGSIPFGLFIGKLYSVDIRKVGSGNIGATNVYRSIGKVPAVITFLFDLFATKGFKTYKIDKKYNVVNIINTDDQIILS
jgi:glycerol-3-phosphate acyltransferase PlsY